MNAPLQKQSVPATSLVTGVGRASYVSVFQPKLNDLNGKQEYSMAFLIPKTDTQTIESIKRASAAALNAKWPDKSRRPPNLRNPLRDGDIEKPDDEAYSGHYWINVKSGNQPGIVDAHVQPVMDARQFVSGDYCRVSINAYAYDQKGNRGVAFGLNNIQVISKGEPLSGGPRAEDVFTVYGDAAFDSQQSPSHDESPWD